MKILKFIPVLILVAGLSFVGCKPKDADIKTSVETALQANPDAAGVNVMVSDAVVTLSGEVKDDATKAAIATTAESTKSVKSVINNLTVPAPPPPPVISADAPLNAAVTDAVKDHPTVTASVSEGVITLTGSIERAKLQPLMQTLNSLNPKSIDNKLTVN